MAAQPIVTLSPQTTFVIQTNFFFIRFPTKMANIITEERLESKCQDWRSRQK